MNILRCAYAIQCYDTSYMVNTAGGKKGGVQTLCHNWIVSPRNNLTRGLRAHIIRNTRKLKFIIIVYNIGQRLLSSHILYNFARMVC